MASHTRRVELVTEITKLRRQQMEAIANATFGCWTVEEEAEHQDAPSVFLKW